MIKRRLSDPFCVAGFVTAVVTFFIFAFYGIGQIVAIILSAVGRKRAMRRSMNPIFGTLGMVIGIIGLVICIVMLLEGYLSTSNVTV